MAWFFERRTDSIVIPSEVVPYHKKLGGLLAHELLCYTNKLPEAKSVSRLEGNTKTASLKAIKFTPIR